MRLIDADVLKTKAIKCEAFKLTDTPVFFKAVGTKEIDKAPTVDAVEVVHGRWITKTTSAGAPYTICSHCNTSVKYNDEYGTVVMNLKGANYCPNCGAKMDEVGE